MPNAQNNDGRDQAPTSSLRIEALQPKPHISNNKLILSIYLQVFLKGVDPVNERLSNILYQQ